MVDSPDAQPSEARNREVAALRQRVDELESQLIDTEAWANRAVAAAEERVYWLDRWHVDLNALMERRGADRIRAALRAVRSVFRLGKRVKRSLRDTV